MFWGVFGTPFWPWGEGGAQDVVQRDHGTGNMLSYPTPPRKKSKKYLPKKD